ncbi:MAG: glycosyltransferase family 4 protein [Chitinophagaceae bacterium]|nr:glycosyltransferase family 4 protein [Chitinophagaceae bacterium]
MMINVLSIVSYPVLPALVGGQKGIALFYKYFSKYVNLVCVATKKNDPLKAEGYTVLNILSNSPFRYINIFYFFTLKKIIRERKISHLLLEHPYYGWLGVLLKKFCGIKLIVHSHNIEALRWKALGKWWWKILWQYEGWAYRQADVNFFKQDDDRTYAIRRFKLHPEKCVEITYGIEQSFPPSPEEKQAARKYLLQEHSIPANHHILLFNGAFNYLPNLNGLKYIIHQIHPALQQINDFQYTILLCGKDIPAQISQNKIPGVVFAGFVPDIAVYFKGADIFLNPITEGGGIKTKLVEALGYDMNAVSTQNGAIGIDPALCNNKLTVVTDSNWHSFADFIYRASRNKTHIPPAYFEHFYWGDIARLAALFIDKK